MQVEQSGSTGLHKSHGGDQRPIHKQKKGAINICLHSVSVSVSANSTSCNQGAQ